MIFASGLEFAPKATPLARLRAAMTGLSEAFADIKQPDCGLQSRMRSCFAAETIARSRTWSGVACELPGPITGSGQLAPLAPEA